MLVKELKALLAVQPDDYPVQFWPNLGNSQQFYRIRHVERTKNSGGEPVCVLTDDPRSLSPMMDDDVEWVRVKFVEVK